MSVSADEYGPTLARVRSALAGMPGEPVIGITFLAEEAVRALAWGAPSASPIEAVVCGALSPDFAFVESWRDGAATACEAVAGCASVPFWVVRGPLCTVAEARGWSDTLAATAREPEALAAALDEAVDEAAASVREAAACGAGAVVVADDLAGAVGPLVAPDFALEEVLPRLGRICRTAAAEDLPLIWHSDGDIRPFLAAARSESVVAVHPGGLGPYPFRELYSCARRLGLSVLGGVPGWAVRAGVPAAIRAATSAALIARSGGLLICDDGGLATGTELGTLIAALQAARR